MEYGTLSKPVNLTEDQHAAARKEDHINLAFRSQTNPKEADPRFYYEPLLTPHPGNEPESASFLERR